MQTKNVTVNQEFLEQMREMMVGVFNDGCEQVIFPRLEELEEKIVESEKRINKELREEFKRGQQVLSNRLEEVDVEVRGFNRRIDNITKNDVEQNNRLNNIERIVKAN